MTSTEKYFKKSSDKKISLSLKKNKHISGTPEKTSITDVSLNVTPPKTGFIDILEELYGNSWQTPSLLKNKQLRNELEERQIKKNTQEPINQTINKKSSKEITYTSHDVYEDKNLADMYTSEKKCSKDKSAHTSTLNKNEKKIATRSSASSSGRSSFNSDDIIDNSVIDVSDSNSDSEKENENSMKVNSLLNTPIYLNKKYTPRTPKYNDSFINDATDSSSDDSLRNTPAFYNRIDSIRKGASVKNVQSPIVVKKSETARKLQRALIDLCDSDSESDDNIASASICNILDDEIDDLEKDFDEIKITRDEDCDAKVKTVIKHVAPSKITKTVKKILGKELTSKKTLSFLESLSENIDISLCHYDALPYVKNFKKTRAQLTDVLYKLYNEKVFGGQLHRDMAIIWSNTLRTTAGFCQPKKSYKNGEMFYTCSVKLSTKVVDRPRRLRDTLIHELCHVANFVIDNVRNAQHGPQWKYWTSKAERCFPDLPKISRLHDYAITYNFLYICDECNHQVKRHKNSFSTNEYCPCGYGIYQGWKRQPDGTIQPISKSTRVPSAFALFVKENYARVKENIGNHKDIMKELSNLYAKQKAGK